MVRWAHISLPSKQHLDWFSHFCIIIPLSNPQILCFTMLFNGLDNPQKFSFPWGIWPHLKWVQPRMPKAGMPFRKSPALVRHSDLLALTLWTHVSPDSKKTDHDQFSHFCRTAQCIEHTDRHRTCYVKTCKRTVQIAVWWCSLLSVRSTTAKSKG